jgi:WhiB family redox-sensing transcriptional regulator
MTANRRFVAQPANPGPWAQQAACTGAIELFTVNWNHHHDGITHRKETAARAVCATCPVLAPCREWALTEPDPAYQLIAGGLDPHQRQQIRRGRVA